MKIDISDLLSIENLTAEQQCELGFSSFRSKMGEFPLVKTEPFVLHFENQENQVLLVSGETDVALSIPCDRCLKEVVVPMHLVIDKRYPIKENTFVESEEEDMGCITGTVLDTDSLVYNEILIHWPMKVLCQKNCKGICKHCGTNLNEKACTCDHAELDPRMAAIQDIFKEFKEV